MKLTHKEDCRLVKIKKMIKLIGGMLYRIEKRDGNNKHLKELISLPKLAKIIIGLTIIILSIISASAFQMTNIPNISANVNYRETTNFRIYNNDSEKIYNATCINTDEFTFTPLSDMLPYEERFMNLTYKTNQSYTMTNKQTTCYSLKRFETIRPFSNQTVSLGTNGFSQTTFTIKQDDYLIILNPQSARTIEELNFGSFNQPVNQNSSIIFSSPTIGNYRLRDSTSGNILYLTIENKTGFDYIRNTVDDKTLNILIESLYQPTNTSLEIFTNSFTMEMDETKQGSGRIKNNAGYPAVNIELLSNDWIVFNKENYSLPKNSEDVFLFTVTPKGITTSAQTNKTYSIEAVMRGSNFPEQRMNISVFINYRTDALISTANATTVISSANPSYNKEFCIGEINRKPDSDMSNLCIKSAFDILNSSNKLSEFYRNYVLRDASSMCSVNVSSDILSNMMLGYSTQADRENNLIGALTENTNDYKTTASRIDQVENNVRNDSKNTNANINDVKNSQNDLLYGIILLLVLVGIAAIGVWYPILKKEIGDLLEKNKNKKLGLPEK